MDQSSPHSTSPADQDEWDTEGFVIPSFGIESTDHSNLEALKVEESKNPPLEDTLEHIYLGPHGAPPQPKQDPNPSTSRKQRFKQKLKAADKKTSSSGRENKVETLRELIIGGAGKTSAKMSKGSVKEWLDPHCDESLFNRLNSQ